MRDPRSTPVLDADRLAVVQRLGRSVIEAEHAAVADLMAGVVRALAAAVGTPAATVSLVDGVRQAFVADVGLPEGLEAGTPVEQSLCRFVVRHRRALVLPDAREHPEYGLSPAVLDLGVVAYAGHPVVVDGHVIGALAALAWEARPWSARDLDVLGQQAVVVSAALQMLSDRVLAREATAQISQFREDRLQGQLEDEVARYAGLTRRHDAALARHAARDVEHRETRALSRRLQRALLPSPAAADSERVRSFYEPGSDRLLLGGDFAAVLAGADGELAFVIGDVSGHGPEAAALAVALRASWATLDPVASRLPDLLGALNEVAHRERVHPDLFATALVGRLTPGGDVSVACAGHPPPVALGPDRARSIDVEPGPPLGVAREHPWHVTTFAAERVLLYTDGIIEGLARPGGSERLGVEGFLAQVTARLDVAPDRLLPDLIDMASTAHGGPLPDDVALLLLQG